MENLKETTIGFGAWDLGIGAFEVLSKVCMQDRFVSRSCSSLAVMLGWKLLQMIPI